MNRIVLFSLSIFLTLTTDYCFSQTDSPGVFPENITGSSTESFSIQSGKDTTFCYSVYGTDCYLGTNMIIHNGKPPYRYAWECKVVYDGNLQFGASYYLSDTTSPTPYFKAPLSNNTWEKFILHIWDDENNYAIDSLKVRFSSFGFLLGYQVHYLEHGDSVLFKAGDINIGGGIPPLSYKWTPVTGLSDTLSLTTWCKPEESTDYSVVLTDSAGCVSEPSLVHEVHVLPTGINENKNDINNKLELHQYNSKIVFKNPENENAIITLFDLSGKEIMNSITTTGEFDFCNILNKKGLYLVMLRIGNITETKYFCN